MGRFTVHQCGRFDRLEVISAAIERLPNVSASQRLWIAVDAPPRSKRSTKTLELESTTLELIEREKKASKTLDNLCVERRRPTPPFIGFYRSSLGPQPLI